MENVKILVIEDEADIRDLLRMNLEAVGYEVDTAADGDEAAEKIRCQGTEINLALTDVMIPGPDGFELFPLMEERGSFMGSRRAWAAVPAQSGRIIKLLFS